MSIDIEREILDIKELVNENNKILKSLQRKSRISFFVQSVKWIILALIAFGIYTFLNPIFEQVLNTYNTVVEGATAIVEIKNKIPNPDWTRFLK